MPDLSGTLGAAGGLIGGPIGAGIGSLAGGLIGLFTGNSQKDEGKELINRKMPQYQIPSEITAAALQGLPTEQYAQAMRKIQRQQMQAIGASQDRRGGLASIGRIQARSNDATLNLDVENAKVKQANQFRLAGYKDKQWQMNVKDPHTRDYNYGMQVLGAGNQNTMTGIDKLGAGLGYLAGGMLGGSRGSDSNYGDPNDGMPYKRVPRVQ